MNKLTGIYVRLAQTPEEVLAAQRLRYKVFYEEWGARADARVLAEARDIDALDQVMDHLIVIDSSKAGSDDAVVGNYRLLRGDVAAAGGKFYTQSQFNIDRIAGSGARLLELGRSCVLREYRGRLVIQMLWQAIAAYVAEHRIDVMFGCASFHGTDVALIEEELSYLYHYHLTHPELRPRALDHGFVDMNIRPKEQIVASRAVAGLEPIIKGYLRLGASIGDGAYIDHQFNSIDVCIVMPTAHLAEKYLRHYRRENQRKPLREGVAAAAAAR